MLTFWEIIFSIIFGVVIASTLVYANMRMMRMYKDEYSKYWTRNKYIILFVIIMLICTFLALLQLSF